MINQRNYGKNLLCSRDKERYLCGDAGSVVVTQPNEKQLNINWKLETFLWTLFFKCILMLVDQLNVAMRNDLSGITISM